ncbi:uncharacterized protein C4orf51 homolog [Rhineura floridana]|uniref:uncharacterized protein C4orf51 homolog n=1 Tax=Rhineura floridana TaxID=261503 RepID=UPI002AC825F6|nr:uncharacterized protein C4orf51 homolog [Rhineura floridana]
MAKYLFLAPGLPLPFSPLSPEAFEEIKCLAGKAWKQHTREDAGCSTTYSGAYGNTGLNVFTHCHVIPSSPTRVHKPHPPEVFLTNQLHHLPGNYGNAKRAVTSDKGKMLQVKQPQRKSVPLLNMPTVNVTWKAWRVNARKRAFPVVAPYLWNALPSEVHLVSLLTSCQRQIHHKAVNIPSPVTPLDAIQQAIKHVNLKGNQTGEEMLSPSSASQDILAGWPESGSTHSVMQMRKE